MNSFKFAHMSDAHLDSWREPELKKLNLDSFQHAIKLCIDQKIEFLLISGDLFHTAAPDYDIIAAAAKELKKLKDSGTRIYVIPGSHDYSYSQKTILNVLENAGLFVNVAKGEANASGKLMLKFTIDEKTGAKITGILGKKGQLEKGFYEALDKGNLEAASHGSQSSEFKIFMFHSGIEEYKPKHLDKMECIPLSLFPKGFTYYAGGHIHHPFDADETNKGYGKILMPGALYPVNFDELVKNETGFFMINDAFVDGAGKWNVKTNRVALKPKDVSFIEINADALSAAETEEKMKLAIKGSDLKDKILLLKVKGQMSSGKPADIKWAEADTIAKNQGAYVVKKNINHLTSKEFEEIHIEQTADLKELEKRLISENIHKDKQDLAFALLKSLELEKDDSETNTNFENRVTKEGKKIIEN